MVEIFLSKDPHSVIDTYKSVYEYAKKEKAARDEADSTMVRSHKSIATAAYICMNSKKYGAKTFSVLYKDYIGLKRAKTHQDIS